MKKIDASVAKPATSVYFIQCQDASTSVGLLLPHIIIHFLIKALHDQINEM